MIPLSAQVFKVVLKFENPSSDLRPLLKKKLTSLLSMTGLFFKKKSIKEKQDVFFALV